MNGRSLFLTSGLWVKLFCLVFTTTLLWLPSALVAADDKPTLQQVVDRHRQALGGPDRLSKTKTRVARGKAELIPGRNSGLSQMSGEAVFYSKAPNKVRMDFVFGSFGVKRGFNGTDAWIKPAPPASDSAMTKAFLSLLKSGGLLHEISVYDGLIEAFQRESELKIKGNKKINDVESYQLELKQTDVTPKLFVDAINGNQIRTTFSVLYNPAASPGSAAPVSGSGGGLIGTAPMSSSGAFSAPTAFNIELDTSDYRDVNGVKLPHAYSERLPFYTIKVTILKYEENVEINDVIFN
ncbi:MAG: hypothetical protein HY774_15445 [Acidobacteria bacterium]|nr:hypothetical protein [Acidobacteriota bacterium]